MAHIEIYRPASRKVLAAMLLCITVFIVSGCASPQKIDTALLESCKPKTFQVGVVKTGGQQSIPLPFGSTHITQKTAALTKIPINEICSTLGDRFSLKINTEVDRTPKVVKERDRNVGGPPGSNGGATFSVQLQPVTENAYYGNLRYDNSSSLYLMLGGSPATINERGIAETVNVTYSMEYQPFSFKLVFLYEISVQSSGQDVIRLNGTVKEISAPMKGLFCDENAAWDAYVQYADQINSALARDLMPVPGKT